MTGQEALAAYRERGDAEAFRRLVVTYQRIVFWACRRRLESPADVAEAVQETFVELARSAGSVQKNLASWLYRRAAGTARDKQASNTTRHGREADRGEMHESDTAGLWRELLPVVDDAIEGLTGDDCELLLQHYFAGRTLAELASTRNVSERVVRKRLKKVGAMVCKSIAGKRVAVSPGILATFLRESAADAAVPAALTSSLMKIDLAGVGKTAGETGTG